MEWQEHGRKWIKWIRTKNSKYLKKVEKIIELYCKEPCLSQTIVAKHIKSSKTTANKILKELQEIQAIRFDKGCYEVNPYFLKYIEYALSELEGDSRVNDNKGTGLAVPPEELYKGGWFRIHGFQRIWHLRNYKLIKDDEEWEMIAKLVDEKSGKMYKQRIGKSRSGVAYVIEVFSEKFRVPFLLRFLSKTLIISLKRGKSIHVPWNEFTIDIEDKIIEEIRYWADRAVKVYSAVFNQQVVAYDGGWVGKKKPLKPQLAYIDPSGTIRKVYEKYGSIYIEGLGWKIDASTSKSSPELEFDDIEGATRFKMLVDKLFDLFVNNGFKNILEELLNSKINKLLRRIEKIENDITLIRHLLSSDLY